MTRKCIAKTFGTLLLAGSILVTASAQGRGNGGGMGNGGGNGTGGNPNPINHPAPITQIVVTGTVTTVDLDGGQYQHQVSIVLQDSKDTTKSYSIIVGPSFYLEEIGLTISKGEVLAVTIFQDFRNDNQWAATVISKTVNATTKTYTLRDAAGYPLWAHAGMGGRHGGGMNGNHGNCMDGQGLDIAKKETLTVNVDAVNLGYRTGPQTMTIKVNGQTATVVLGPYWWLQEKNFQVKTGDSVTVVIAPYLNTLNTYAAILIKIGDVSLQLRDETTGVPLWFQRN